MVLGRVESGISMLVDTRTLLKPHVPQRVDRIFRFLPGSVWASLPSASWEQPMTVYL